VVWEEGVEEVVVETLPGQILGIIFQEPSSLDSSAPVAKKTINRRNQKGDEIDDYFYLN